MKPIQSNNKIKHDKSALTNTAFGRKSIEGLILRARQTKLTHSGWSLKKSVPGIKKVSFCLMVNQKMNSSLKKGSLWESSRGKQSFLSAPKVILDEK